MTCTASPVAAFGSCTPRALAGATTSLAVTMKMMSSTSMMSTSGVTLMPLIMLPPFPALPAIGCLLAFGRGGRAPLERHLRGEVRKQDVAQRLGVRAHRLDPALVPVERGHRGNGDEESHGGRHQRFRDGRHDRLRG